MIVTLWSGEVAITVDKLRPSTCLNPERA